MIPALKKTTLQDGAISLPFYMYLDNELMDIEHLCCLAHARTKFKYSYDQGSLQTRIFLELIARLYGMEDTYRREKITADEISAEGNDGEYSIDNMVAERAIKKQPVLRKCERNTEVCNL